MSYNTEPRELWVFVFESTQMVKLTVVLNMASGLIACRRRDESPVYRRDCEKKGVRPSFTV